MSTATINLLNWFSPSTMQSLAWTLLHFLWQGTAIASCAAAVMAIVRRASVRYLVGIGALVLMLLAPTVTFFYFSQPRPLAMDSTNSRPGSAARPAAKLSSVSAGSIQPVSVFSRETFPWLVEAWLLGVAFFSLRSAGGFFLLERQRRRQSTVVNARVLELCRAIQTRFGLKRAIAYCECKWLQAPAVVGWFRPIVFLPITALTGLSDEQLRMVIAHELAHIRRFDPFVNVFQVCVETLLFYHPAVWWLNRRIRADREHCCDEKAVALCGNAVEYARALTLMEEWRGAPAFAMAANRGPLAERIFHLLGLNYVRGATRNIGLAASVIFLGGALFAGNALFGIAYPKTTYAGSRLLQGIALQAQPARQATPAPVTKPSPAQTLQSKEEPNGSQSYIEGLKAAGLTITDVDQLVALKVQGVTPDYIRGIHELGLHPDADGFVALKVQGVTPEYIKGLRSLGFNPDADEIIAMKVQGVDAEYVRGMKEVGIQGDADSFVALKVQGVTPDYVRQLRAQGLTVNSDDVVALKVQGVTPEYVQGLRAQGFNPSADDVVGMKVQGVTPEYIRDIRGLGLNPSADEVVGMKVQGVTPEYIKTLQAAGFKPSVDDVIGAKVQGITPEFIDAARKHGFSDLTIEKLIELKHLGILDSKGEI